MEKSATACMRYKLGVQFFFPRGLVIWGIIWGERTREIPTREPAFGDFSFRAMNILAKKMTKSCIVTQPKPALTMLPRMPKDTPTPAVESYVNIDSWIFPYCVVHILLFCQPNSCIRYFFKLEFLIVGCSTFF